MAKKVVATLQSGVGKNFTRCIRMVKSPKTGSYVFDEEIVHNDHINDFFNRKKL
jgi:ABC-type histidine transport system ATPase subunit